MENSTAEYVKAQWENVKTEEDYWRMILSIQIKHSEDVQSALQAGDEKKAAEIISCWCDNWGHGKRNVLLWNVEGFKDQRLLYDLIIDVYTMDGYDFQKSLIKTAKRLSRQIPESKRLEGLPSGDPITVWRGTRKEVKRSDISWTTDKQQASWWAYRGKGEPGSVWEATIKRGDIIAYTDDRGEREVIQYLSVQNVRRLDISLQEMEEAYNEVEAEHAEHNKHIQEELGQIVL